MSISRIDALTEEIKSLRKSINPHLKLFFSRFFSPYHGSMWWMFEFYNHEDPEYRAALETSYEFHFPDSLSNGDLLEIGKLIKKWTGYSEYRTPGWIHYMERLQVRVKKAKDNLTMSTLRLRFLKANVDTYIIPDLANIVGEYFVSS